MFIYELRLCLPFHPHKWYLQGCFCRSLWRRWLELGSRTSCWPPLTASPRHFWCTGVSGVNDRHASHMGKSKSCFKYVSQWNQTSWWWWGTAGSPQPPPVGQVLSTCCAAANERNMLTRMTTGRFILIADTSHRQTWGKRLSLAALVPNNGVRKIWRQYIAGFSVLVQIILCLYIFKGRTACLLTKKHCT